MSIRTDACGNSKGYEISDAEIRMTLADFSAKYGDGEGVESVSLTSLYTRLTDWSSKSALNFFATKPDDQNQKIYIFFSDESSVGIKTMRRCGYLLLMHIIVLISMGWAYRFIGILDDKQVQVGIIIWSTAMTSAAKKVLPFCFLSL